MKPETIHKIIVITAMIIFIASIFALAISVAALFYIVLL